MNRCLREAHVSEWMTKGRNTLIQKDPREGTTLNNYRPITCLFMIWKILTAQMREEIYFLLTSRGLFTEEQKKCYKGSRDTGELLYFDQHIFNESKKRRKNLVMARIDNKRASDMVPPKLDNKLSQNVQKYQKIHKLYRENHENLENGIDSRREKLS